jgi:hypothetical protein
MEVMLAVAVLGGLAFSVPAAEAVATSSTDSPIGPHDAINSPSATTRGIVAVPSILRIFLCLGCRWRTYRIFFQLLPPKAT